MAFSATELSCVRGERQVFAGIGFSLAPGDALLVRGPNGAGKSSLLRIAAALLRPAAGTLSWNGEDIFADADGHHERLQYLGHMDGVKPLLTAAENVAFWARLRGAGRGDAASPALDAFGIAHLAAMPTRLLSAGQRKRVALARLAAAPAALWLLDEPTVSLDDDGVAALEAAIARHRAGGGIVMLATHAERDLPAAKLLRLGPGPAAGR